jgi:hypothetical protein
MAFQSGTPINSSAENSSARDIVWAAVTGQRYNEANLVLTRYRIVDSLMLTQQRLELSG